MLNHYQKTKRTIKIKSRLLWERIIFVLKTSFVLIVLFLMVLFYVTEPSFSLKSVFTSNSVVSLLDSTREERFIDKLAPYAKNAQAIYGVRPSLLIAQAALESSWGDSALSQEANNYFGIKGISDTEDYLTNEYANDEWIQIQASFKKYASVEESVMDYAQLLVNGTSWNPNLYQGVIMAPNFQKAAKAIQDAGYATDPDYANKVIRIIEQYRLYELDN